MHRTNRMPYPAFGILLLSLMLGGLPAGGGRAADELIPPPRREAAADTNLLIVPLGASQRLQMKGKKVISTAVNPKENILVVQPVPGDPTSVLLTGRDTGTTQLTLTAADKTVEVYRVVVQLDVEYLRSVLQRAVPTASLQLIPAAGNQIIIGGTVAHSGDVDIIMRAATGFGNPISAMQVGGVMQVQLDVVVARVDRTQLRSMGFDWLNTGHQHNLSSMPSLTSPTPTLLNPGPGSTIPPIPRIDIPVTNVVNPPPGLFLGLFNQQQTFFGWLQALRTEGLAKLLAEPRLVALSGQRATFVSGFDQPVPNGGGLGGVSIGFQRLGTTLAFIPIVLGNGKIRLEVEPEVSAIDSAITTPVPQTGSSIPGHTVQRVHTTVEMQDGQTFVIGGLIQHSVNGTTHKVPVLGDLPFLGAAFSNKTFTDEEQELVIMVTPHLVDPMACNQLPNLLPGQETRNPDDFELFLEGILEAPRGPRNVFPNCHYVPAYKNSPTAEVFPCAKDPGSCCNKGNYNGPCACNNGGCAGGTCAAGTCAGGACAGGSVGTCAACAGNGNGAAGRAGAPRTVVVNRPVQAQGASLLPPVDVDTSAPPAGAPVTNGMRGR